MPTVHRRRRSLGIVVAALAAAGAYVLFTSGRASCPGTGTMEPGRAAAPDGPGPVLGGGTPTLASRPVPAAPDSPEETRLEGVVLEFETGDPIGGARVRWGAIEAETDAGGTYRLRAVGALPEVDEIVARAEGFLGGSTSCDRQVRSPAGRLAPLFLGRARERRLGRVRDGLDRPVEGAVILVGPQNDRHVSRADGSFGPLPMGSRGVHWRAFSVRQGRAEGSWDGEATPSELEVVLPVAAFVEGEVVDEGGRPVPGASVFALRHADELRLESGPDGRFRWPLAPAALETLAATTVDRAGFAQVYAGAPTRIVVQEGARLPESSSASAPPSSDPRYGADAERTTIQSVVVDARGRPVPGAEVAATAPDGSWRTWEWTDADGRFALEVYAAPVDVRVSHFWHPCASTEWHLRLDAGTTSLPTRIELPRRRVVAEEPFAPPSPKPRVLEGRVLDAEGRPVPGAKVSATGTDEFDRTDVRGRFALEGLPTDRPARVTLRADGTPPIEAIAPLGLPSLQVVLPARGSIVVLLRGAPTTEDAPSPTLVRLGTSDEPRDVFLANNPWEDGWMIDEGGRVRIDAPEGRFVLRFRRAPGIWERFAGVEVVAGRETRLTYDFPTFGRLRLVAQDLEGVAVADATVSLAEVDSLLGYTGADGVLVPPLDGTDASFPAGVHRLRVVTDRIVPGFVPAFTEPVDLRRDVEVTVHLARGESLSGDVAEAEGGLSGGGTLAWRAPFGPPVVLGTVDDDGTFGPLIPLPAGRQTLVLTRGGSPDADLPVDVRPGASGEPLHLRLR